MDSMLTGPVINYPVNKLIYIPYIIAIKFVYQKNATSYLSACMNQCRIIALMMGLIYAVTHQVNKILHLWLVL